MIADVSDRRGLLRSLAFAWPICAWLLTAWSGVARAQVRGGEPTPAAPPVPSLLRLKPATGDGIPSYSFDAEGRTLATFGDARDRLYSPFGLRLGGPLTVSTPSTGIAGQGVAGSFILNQDRSFPPSLAPETSGYPGVSVGAYPLLGGLDSVALYTENQSGALATIWPATFDAHHVTIDPTANGGRGPVRIGYNRNAQPPFSEPYFYPGLPPEVMGQFVAGSTLVDTFTMPHCRARVMSWTASSITVDRWLEVGKADQLCGGHGNPQQLRQLAGVGIAYVGSRNGIWLQNGNLYLDNIETTTSAITDELAVYNRTGHYSVHGYDSRFPSGLFPQADGPFVAGALRFSSGTKPGTGVGGDGYQGTVAYGSIGDWEYGFWSRNARKAHFLIAPSDPAHLGAVGLLDTEPFGKAFEVKPGNREDRFSVDRVSGNVVSKGMIVSGTATLAQAPPCDSTVLGAHFYITNARKPQERAGEGSGAPVDCSPPRRNARPAWLSVYDHEPAAE